jgi:hypothetical protein
MDVVGVEGRESQRKISNLLLVGVLVSSRDTTANATRISHQLYLSTISNLDGTRSRKMENDAAQRFTV